MAAAKATMQAMIRGSVSARPAVPSIITVRASRSLSSLSGGRSLCLHTSASLRKTAQSQASRSMAGTAGSKNFSFRDYFESRKDDFFNISLSALFFIVTLQMLRTKGDKLDDERRHSAREQELEEEIQRLKTQVVQSVESGTPGIAKSLGLWQSSSEELKKKMVALVSSAVEEASTPPRGKDEAQTFVNARSSDDTQLEDDTAGSPGEVKKGRSLV